MLSNVFTIFNHGTDFHRDTNANELINHLSHAMQGVEARLEQTGPRTKENPMPFVLQSEQQPTYLICEGPGSEEVSANASASGVHHAYPGKFNPIFNTSKNIGGSQQDNSGLTVTGGRKYWFFGDRKTSEFQDSFMGNTPETMKLMGLALGRGWTDNVYKAVWMLTHLKFEMGYEIDTVNIVGWSRGAVTCLMMANKLFEVFEDTININIFAVDPVPGGYTSRAEEMIAIPPNVRNYLALLALDADGANFQATDRTTLKYLAPKSQHGKTGNPDSLNPQNIKPNVHFLPMPGNHSDLVNVNLSHPLLENGVVLCRYLAEQFLYKHGSFINIKTPLSDKQALEHYEAMFPHLKDIAQAASTGGYLSLVEGFKVERAVRKVRGTYVHDADKYLNEHHRVLALQRGGNAATQPIDSFNEQQWTNWNESTLLDLSQEQSDLRRMGLSIQ